MVGLFLLFTLELVVISIWLDGASLSHSSAVTRAMQLWGAWTLRAIVAFVSLFLIFFYFQAKSFLLDTGRSLVTMPARWTLLAGHIGSLVLFWLCSRRLFGGSSAGAWTNTTAAGFIGSGLLAILFGAVLFVPWAVWSRLLNGSGYTWAYAGVVAVATCWLGNSLRLLWGPAVRATFLIVKLMLSPFLPKVISTLSTATIGSPTFYVDIAPACCGLEGMGLMLVFAVVWLWLSRQELRFPQAILVVPVSLAAAFLLNSARIAALILIGNAGAPGIAAGGFHSQAGWISFNMVALGMVVSIRHVPWIARTPADAVPAGHRADNPSALYVLPFLAILAAGMVSRAFTAQFEWLYPLRLLAVAWALFHYRKQYRTFDWSFGWLAPIAGTAVFGLWIALDRLSPAPATSGISPGHGAAWVAWLVFRTVGAAVTVPIAEELAFRGYLMRRLVSEDFDQVDFRGIPWLAVAISSLLFGLMHGNRWFAGTLAGVAYALVLRRSRRMGEAIAAHGITNALLAILVMTRGAWRYW